MSSYIVYNNVILNVTELISFTRVPVYDGPQWLYNKVNIHVRCTYNPNTVSYTPDPTYTPYVIPLAQDGNLPATTDQAIRHALSQPRGPLLYVVGNQTLVSSPGFQPDRKTLYPCDAKAGPYPVVHDIIEHVGRKTYLVDFAIETFVNEAWNEMPVAPVVLSHRWVRQQFIDEDFYTTVTTQGHAIFRADVLAVFQINGGSTQNFTDRNPTTMAYPDDFRSYLFHEVPNGFKRESAMVRATIDGMGVEYMLVDRQVEVIFPQGVTRMRAWQSIGSVGGSLQFASDAAKTVISAVAESKLASDTMARWNSGTEGKIGVVSDWLTGVTLAKEAWNGAKMAGNAIAGATQQQVRDAGNTIIDSATKAAFQAGRPTIPMMAITVEVSVWGDKSSTMQQLTNAAHKLTNERFSIFKQNYKYQFGTQTSAKWTHSLIEKFCTLQIKKQFPMPAAIITIGDDGQDNIPDILGGGGGFFGVSTGNCVPAVPPQSSAVLADASSKSYPIPNASRAYFYGDQSAPNNFEVLAAQLFLADFAGTPAPRTLGNGSGSIQVRELP